MGRLIPDQVTMRQPPQLLVSVRSPEEAIAALSGGADLIDVKEPRNGPLGAASPETIAAITEVVRREGVKVSAALGEFVDREGTSDMAIPSVDYVKIGLARLRGVSNWRQRLCEFRAAAMEERCEHRSPPAWIAVAYADEVEAGSPPLKDVVDAAIEDGFQGLLIDTCSKSSGRLPEMLSPLTLAAVVGACHDAGLFVALAGRLRTADLASVLAAGPDIVAVRSAVCRAGDRDSDVASHLVEAMKRTLADLCGAGDRCQNPGSPPRQLTAS
jgi:uncharacterized protein (UPF0264 family)